MSRKILIVGGVAGGASAAARLRRLSEEDQIIMFERGPHVSFSNCSIPYFLSGMIDSAEDLVLMNPGKFLKQYNIEARVNQEVIGIDRKNKLISVQNKTTNTMYTESYDKLILSPGAKPIMPRFEGIEKVQTFGIRNVEDISRLKNYIIENKATKITVIGGGFIGVEVVENLVLGGYEVTLIEAINQILRTFDEDMVQIFHKELLEHGVKLILGDKVNHFESHQVILESGHVIDTDLVVMAIGVAPETGLAESAGIALGVTKAIKVDEDYLTNDTDIYAVGDAIEVMHALTGAVTKLSLAGPAQKQARAVADHINGNQTQYKGVIGSSAIKVFDYNGASTGLNENLIQSLGLKLSYDKVLFILGDKVGLMPDSNPMFFKLLFEVPTGRVLGAQAIGKGTVDKRIDVVATAIKFGATVNDLKELELCYAPTFGTAKDIVNYAGYIASNLLDGDFKQVSLDQVRLLLEQGETFIDVREKGEYDYGHLKGATNIPLSELRKRVEEIPKDRPVYLHCRTGQRSYNAVLALQNFGYPNVINVTGGFLGTSFYEYYHDQTLNRDPILTNYNFY